MTAPVIQKQEKLHLPITQASLPIHGLSADPLTVRDPLWILDKTLY